MSWKQSILVALGAIGTSLLMGKTFRSLVLWPFVKWAKWTANTKDDTIIQIAEKDLGIEEEINKLQGDKQYGR